MKKMPGFLSLLIVDTTWLQELPVLPVLKDSLQEPVRPGLQDLLQEPVLAQGPGPVFQQLVSAPPPSCIPLP